MIYFRAYILLILFGEAFMLLKKSYEMRFISLNAFRSDYIDYGHLRLVGRERTVNGTLEIKQDLDDTLYSVSAESFNDPNGNGEYKQLPMSIPRQAICKAMQSYWKYLEASLKYGENTNFPTHTRPCPLPKGIYYFKDVKPQTDDWPAIMPRGFIKGVVNLFKENETVSTLEIVGQISDIS